MDKVTKKLALRILVIIELTLFIAFLYADIFLISNGNEVSIYIKYSTIILCFIITLLIGKDGFNSRDTLLVQLARILTVIADYFLLIKDDFKLGILCFCAVQIIYIIRHSLMEKQVYKNAVFLFIASLFAIVSSKIIKISNFDGELLFIGCIYAAFLLTSVYCGVRALKSSNYPKNSALLICIGLILFLFCDLNVALFNIVQYIGYDKYTLLTVFLIWLFYFPSQLMLSLSGFKVQYINSLLKGI